MKVLVACECSGVVRDAFAAKGHDAWSCDLQPSERPGQHIQADVLTVLDAGWDLMVGHPECRFLCNSGIKHLYFQGKKDNGPDPDRWYKMAKACNFFLALWRAPIPMIALENSEMHTYAVQILGMKRDQVVQPWQFGATQQKAIHLWLKNLPPLKDTDNVYEAMMRLPKAERTKCHYASPGPERSKNRSRFLPEVAGAMAEQWGSE